MRVVQFEEFQSGTAFCVRLVDGSGGASRGIYIAKACIERGLRRIRNIDSQRFRRRLGVRVLTTPWTHLLPMTTCTTCMTCTTCSCCIASHIGGGVRGEHGEDGTTHVWMLDVPLGAHAHRCCLLVRLFRVTQVSFLDTLRLQFFFR